MTSVDGANGIKAIQTRYAGCHFRSRLEARWAVFFDQFGVEWEYEPEGFELSWRLTFDEGVIHYLPDFWLPGLQTWVEVKGSWTEDECDQFLNAAAALSSPGGGCGDANVALVSNIPDPKKWWHWRPVLLHMHKGDLEMSAATFDFRGCSPGITIARDVGGPGVYSEAHQENSLANLTKSLLNGVCHISDDWESPARVRYSQALTAARSARFEHSESGAA